MKVALVQDWLTELGGAEKVFKEISMLYPDADVYTLVYNDAVLDKLNIKQEKVTASFIQKLPFGKKKYRNYLPFFIKAIESFDLSDYDLIISSSYSVAKGVLCHSDQTHICYCHSPVRYAWDLYHQYMREAGIKNRPKAWLIKKQLRKLRLWDVMSANRVDHFISNSDFIKARIAKVYRREATTIYPPVSVNQFKLQTTKHDFFITCSRLVPYKKIDLIVKTFAQLPNQRLKVIGTGPDMAKIKALAGANVEILGYQTDEVLRSEMANAKAFIFAAKEDFGIVPLEAQACGTPVVAFGEGGALETVVEGETGCFFYEQTTEALKHALQRFETIKTTLDPQKIQNHAHKFDVNRFKQELNDFINTKTAPHRKNKNTEPTSN